MIMVFYKTSDFRGQAMDPIGFANESGDALFRSLCSQLPEALKRSGVPADCIETEVKSGGLFGTKRPMLIVRHPNPPSEFFKIAFVVNDNLINAYYLGESKENTKKNMKEAYIQEGRSFKAAMIKVDDFVLQQEEMWGNSIYTVFKGLIRSE